MQLGRGGGTPFDSSFAFGALLAQDKLLAHHVRIPLFSRLCVNISSGRGGGTRTHDLMNPNHVL